VLLAVVSRVTPLSGSFPILHVGIPWGLTKEGIPDLSGKYCLVTGASSGLGKGIAFLLAQNGAHVILACRSMSDCNEAVRETVQEASKAGSRNKAHGKQIIKAMKLDLANLESVESFVKEYKVSSMPIHHLYLNAGVMFPEHGLTKDGFETQFGVNHVGHQALTMALLNVIKETSKSSPVSIIAVSSVGHYNCPPGGVYPTLEQINDPSLYDRGKWYGQSKLANILMAKQLAKNLENEGFKQIRVQAVQYVSLFYFFSLFFSN
jgi:NAD(P)-dependent dehydrogenase (short-subunit alcohol dehydrogenase family)